MANVRLKRQWFFEGVLYEPGVRTIVGLEGYAAKWKKSIEEVLPKGASIVDGPVTDLPQTHPTVTTLSEMGKTKATDAVTASKGPTVVISEEEMGGTDGKPKPEPKK